MIKKVAERKADKIAIQIAYTHAGARVHTHKHTHTHIYIYIYVCVCVCVCRYSDWLRIGRSGDQIPVAESISTPVQTGPGTHPASYTMGTGSLPRG